MKKILLIGMKDLRLAFRDRAALIMMLAAPFLLTLGLGVVTGRFSGGSSLGVSHIPVVLVDQDGGQLGSALVDLFRSSDLDELIDATVGADPEAAYRQVDENQAVAAVVVPAGFTDSIIPPQGQAGPPSPVEIELYANPTAPTSVGVVKTVLDQFISQAEVGRVGGQVIVTQLVASGRLQAQQALAAARSAGATQADAAGRTSSITLDSVTPSGRAVQFDVLAVLAPGMALMFLMYTVSYGARTLLTERAEGTLPRLLVSPTTAVQVLGGKMVGIFLTGFAQMYILVEGTSLIFGVRWGDPVAVGALLLAVVFGAVGWGLLLAAIAKTPGQVAAYGSAVMLTFGILGGSFISMDNFPAWLRLVTKITPNAWGLDGFSTLALGGGLPDVLTPILALLAMGSILFVVAALLLNRRGLAQA